MIVIWMHCHQRSHRKLKNLGLQVMATHKPQSLLTPLDRAVMVISSQTMRRVVINLTSLRTKTWMTSMVV
jgi:hypothetical protein